MYFRMASGHFGAPPENYSREAIVAALLANAPDPASAPQLRAFIVERHVSTVIADANQGGPWLAVLSRLGLKSVHAGGVLVYRVPASWGSRPA